VHTAITITQRCSDYPWKEEEKEREKERDRREVTLLKRLSANRVQSCREVCGGLEESLGEIDKGVKKV